FQVIAKSNAFRGEGPAHRPGGGNAPRILRAGGRDWTNGGAVTNVIRVGYATPRSRVRPPARRAGQSAWPPHGSPGTSRRPATARARRRTGQEPRPGQPRAHRSASDRIEPGLGDRWTRQNSWRELGPATPMPCANCTGATRPGSTPWSGG